MNDTAGQIQLSHGSAISYKVFARSFPGTDPVLFLMATCYYPTGEWEIFFTGNGNFSWNLMEKVPGLVNHLVTYYVASWTSSFPMSNIPSSVTIVDAFGSHSVPVEPWG